jgi:hypothetical protein
MIRKNWVSVATTRKIFNTIGHVGPAVMLVGLSFISCDQTLAILCLCIALTLSAGMYPGFGVVEILKFKKLQMSLYNTEHTPAFITYQQYAVTRATIIPFARLLCSTKLS